MENYTDSLSDYDDVNEEEEEEPLLPVEFTNRFTRLPASAPANHAHVIDLSSYNPDLEEECYDVKVWNVVCTMLFNISKETLNDFLDSSVKTFQLVQEFEGSRSNTKLLIWRKGSETLFAQYTALPKEDLLEFENLVLCTVNYDGSWKLNAASFWKYTRNNLDNAWDEIFIATRIERELNAYSVKDQAEFADILGAYILQHGCWNADEGCKWTIKKT